MPYLGLLFLAHSVLLVLATRRTARRLFEAGFLQFFAVILLIWANLAYTAYITSLTGVLDVPLVYFGVSAGLTLLIDRAFRYIAPDGPAADIRGIGEIASEVRQTPFAWLTLCGLGIFVTLVTLLALASLANNWDTLAYRFPRVVFFLNGTGLLHPAAGIDPRLLFYPFNGSLLYLFLAQYQLTGVAWNFVSVAAWLLTGAAAFYVPIQLGGSVRAAAFSCFTLMTTPIVLCLATSTNDEVLAALPMMLCMIFAIHWLRTRTVIAFVLGVFGLAISAGTKLHWAFYLPGVIGLLFLLATHNREEVKALWHGILRRGVLALALLMATPFAVSFLVANYISAGKLTHTDFNKDLLNTPFHFGVAWQTFRIYTAQMLLSPIPDHFLFLGAKKETELIAGINETTNRTVFSGVQQGPPYTSPYYKFRGVIDPDGASQYEQTLWLGLTPWLLFAAIFFMASRRSEFHAAVWCFALSLPCWHLGFSVLTRYVECVGTYYAYAAPIGIAPIGFLWERLGRSDSSFARGLSRLFPVLLISNAFLGITLLFGSGKRDVTQAFRTTNGETPVSETSPRLRPLLQSAKNVHINYTHWELLYWNLMRLNPAARYHTGAARTGQDIDLYLIPHASAFNWDTVAVIRSDKFGILRKAGTMSSGSDAIFCHGPRCEAACEDCPKHFQLPVYHSRKGANLELRVTGAASGANSASQGAVRFTLFNASTLAKAASDWVALPKLPNFVFSAPDQQFDHIQVEAGCEAGLECEVERTVLALRPGVPYLLNEMPQIDAGVPLEQISQSFGPGWEGTEGSGYWKFTWKLRPGTNKMDAHWVGQKGEQVRDEMTVTAMSKTEVKILRSTTNSHFVGRWITGEIPAAKGYAVWDPTNIWQGRRAAATK
ncbi:MAG: hypothetical protein FJW30_13130 [Acidobacteria bacterium]|nr:hypothetical protein [Acidobacteriota bacterium]